MSRKSYATNKWTHIIKTHISEEQYQNFVKRCAEMKISQSDFIRKAIRGAPIQQVIIVDGKEEEMLECVSALLTQCKRIGNNLNQLAHYYNAGGADTETMRRQLRQNCKI